MKKGDIIYAEKISDFGDTAAEACDIYFSLIGKEESISFYECSYLDTDVTKLPVTPAEETRMMISRMIDNCFSQNGNPPRVSIQERNRILEMKRSKKNQLILNARKAARTAALHIAHDSCIKNVLIYEEVITSRTYERLLASLRRVL